MALAQKLQTTLLSLGILLVLTACQIEPAAFKAPTLPGNQSLFSFAQPRTPAPFMWGVSTAGHQSEGNNVHSQWYHWEQAGKTEHVSGKAVDFYNRYEEDIRLARDMGTNAFRMSIEWSRIEPEPGQIDRQAIEHYRTIIQTVKKYGMTPLVTLIHFTYPQWLNRDRDGDRLIGWEDPDVVEDFLRYVGIVVREFSPDVTLWLTFNEPNIWLPIAHLFGKTPPGHKSPLGFIRAGMNVLNAHSRAYDAIHAINPQAMVSANVFQFQYNPFGKTPKPLAMNLTQAAITQPAAVAAAAQDMADDDWFMNALQTGQAPYQPTQIFAQGHMQAKGTGTVALLKRFDYVALDYYYRFTSLKQIINAAQTWAMPIYPEGLYPVLMNYHRRFGKPIIIAENGIGTFDNQPRKDGWTRSAVIVQHVNQMQRAMKDGANVLGYFHWSITDNYEWGDFHSRFGLYQVEALTDPELKRIPTEAVSTYKQVIASQGINAQLLQAYPGPQR